MFQNFEKSEINAVFEKKNSGVSHDLEITSCFHIQRFLKSYKVGYLLFSDIVFIAIKRIRCIKKNSKYQNFKIVKVHIVSINH